MNCWTVSKPDMILVKSLYYLSFSCISCLLFHFVVTPRNDSWFWIAEIMDFGYPQNLSPEILKLYITQEGVRSPFSSKVRASIQ